MALGRQYQTSTNEFSRAAITLLKCLWPLTQLREWVGSFPPNVVAVREDWNPNYGGLLFEVRPANPDAMPVTVGLGTADDIDLFWGENYRWEGWKAVPTEVPEVREAIKEGDVIEETWKLGKYVVEKRCYIRPDGRRAGDGSFPIPRWLKRWARLSVRKYSPWLRGAA